MAIARKMQDFSQRASWIRRMFEEGARLKAQFGRDNVCDFSLGNPDLAPPSRFRETLITLAIDEEPGAHAYMANSGYHQVRKAVAAQVSAEQGVVLSATEILMTCGAAGALNVVMKSLLDPGDEGKGSWVTLAPFSSIANCKLAKA